VLDERYFYEGAKFAVYLVSALPILLLLALALGTGVWLPSRLLPARLRARAAAWACGRLAPWGASPVRLSLAGIAFAVVMIQLVMRQPFIYSNLLVARDLPPHGWLGRLLLTENEGLRSLYFTGLVTATVLTVAVAVFVGARGPLTGVARPLWQLLVAVAAVQFLLLPVNYGFLITATALPRVASPGGPDPAPRGEEIWLAWEGKDGVTYLVRDRTGGGDRRTLLTVPRKDVSRIEITGYDPILRVLFARPPAPAAAGAPPR